METLEDVFIALSKRVETSLDRRRHECPRHESCSLGTRADEHSA